MIEVSRIPPTSHARASEKNRTRGLRFRPGLAALVVLAFSSAGHGQVPVAPRRYEHHAVVCESAAAAAAGAQILAAGGNAVDAAVATAFALAVTYPQAGNIGGGGFLVLYLADREGDDRWTCFDFRERAPARAHAEMFLDDEGHYDPRRHHEGYLSVGVPGTVAGLALAHSLHGRRSWKEVLAPAIRLAREGFELPGVVAASIARILPELKPAASSGYFHIEGHAPRPGDRLVQRDLARTLERIAAEGPGEFYRGETAGLLVAEMRRGGGWIDTDDLASYRAEERHPILFDYRGYRIGSMPPPSSGGVALAEMLHVLEGYDLRGQGAGSAATIHLVAEAMRRAFADRARFLADPDLVEIPVARLTSPEHARRLRATISTTRASESSPDRFEWPEESDETTHLSVVDAEGNAVALTTTLEYSFGSRIVVPGAGFLLNNEMGDFNPGPGLTREDGLIGTAPNLAAPRKRMLSSMCPTIVQRGDGEWMAVLGSPGGRSIINTVLCTILDVCDFGMAIQPAVDAPRVHHQWLPDVLWLERGHSPDTLRLLKAMGHNVRYREGSQGSVMAIVRKGPTGELEVGVDRRRGNGASAGR